MTGNKSSPNPVLEQILPSLKLLTVQFTFIVLVVLLVSTGSSSAWAKRSNILLIMADDLGFSDIGPFGSEIETPSLQALSEQGLRLTRFYTSPLCSPTRSMLMSGTDNHLAGLGTMWERIAGNQVGQPGYEGFLNRRVASLATLMKDAGYHTYMAGKWHLGGEEDLTPTGRGFERSFALLNGSSDHYNQMLGSTSARPTMAYWQDGQRIYSLPESYYSSDFLTSRILEYIDSNLDSGKPFFAYLAFTAPHWPLQAPAQTVMKYRGRYAEGWDILREKRFAQARKLGLIPATAVMPPRPAHIPAWDSLDAETKAREERLMEVYAAMVDRMDQNIGRLIKYLKQQSVYEDTYIVFMSDNGADAFEYRDLPTFADWHQQFDNSFEMIGRRGSFSIYGAGWGQAGEAPFRLTKGFTTEGGMRSPAIFVDPDNRRAGELDESLVTVMDWLPTFLDIAGSKPPGTQYKGREIHPPSGQSILPLLNEPKNRVHDEDAVFGMEMYNGRAIYKGNWKLLRVREPFNNGEWELFDLSTDPGEQKDLAQLRPEKLAELIKDWDAYVISRQVILPEGPYVPR